MMMIQEQTALCRRSLAHEQAEQILQLVRDFGRIRDRAGNLAPQGVTIALAHALQPGA
jgi:hypothetical protein